MAQFNLTQFSGIVFVQFLPFSHKSLCIVHWEIRTAIITNLVFNEFSILAGVSNWFYKIMFYGLHVALVSRQLISDLSQ